MKKTIYDSLVPKEAQKAFGEDGTRKYISESYKDVQFFESHRVRDRQIKKNL